MDEIRDKRGMTEAEAVAHFRSQNYPKPSLTADFAVFTQEADVVRLLMIRRGGHPYLGCWALPGGFADENEAIENTAARELEEETHVKGLSMKMVGVYSAPGRDPRGWVVSVAYATCVPAGSLQASAGDDAAETAWLEVRRGADGAVRVDLPEGGKLAFDHGQIIQDAFDAKGL